MYIVFQRIFFDFENGKKMSKSLLFATIVAGSILRTAFADPIIVGTPKLLYTTDKLPIDPICSLSSSIPSTIDYCNTAPLNSAGKDLLSIDGSVPIIKNSDGSMGFFYNFANGFALFKGTPDKPFPSLPLWSEKILTAFPYATPVDIRKRVVKTAGHPGQDHIYIANIYHGSNSSADPMIGFIHYEDIASCKDADVVNDVYSASCSSYHIGLANSTDRGKTWHYMGHVINTSRNGGYGDDGKNNAHQTTNIGGVPYLVKDGYFYVYYHEYPSVSGTDYKRYVSVARALISDVVNAASNGNVSPPWYKYNNGTWTQSALTGLGSSIFEAPQDHGNTHTDAVYSNLTKKYYLITVEQNLKIGNSINLYSSFDGIKWDAPNSISSGSVFYPFISPSSFIDNDAHTVGKDFYVLYAKTSPRYHEPNYLRCLEAGDGAGACQDIYQVKVTLGAGDVSPIIDNVLRN